MAESNSKPTIVSMAVITSSLATLLHEALGHGVVAWLRGDVVTELTSNHLSAMRADRWVDAGGTLVNLILGAIFLAASEIAGKRANLRYFLWLLAAFNLLPGAGYFMLSGIVGIGDWQAVINGLPHQIPIRIAMSIFGAVLTVVVVRLLAITIRPFAPDGKRYNTVGRLPYYAACIFGCMAGAFDPLGIAFMLTSTIPAAFGGYAGLMWADSLIPAQTPRQILTVRRQPAWWVAALLLGGAYIYFLGRGIRFPH